MHLMLTNTLRARLYRLAPEAIWIGCGQALSAVGAIVGAPLLIRTLPPSVYGTIALTVTVVTVVQQVLSGPLSNAASRFFSAAVENGYLSKYLSTIRLSASGVVLIISAGTAALLVMFHGASPKLLVAASAYALVSGFNCLMDGMQNAARQRRIVAWHQALVQWLRFGCAIGFVHLCGATAEAVVLGFLVASAVVFGSQAVFFTRTLHLFRSHGAAQVCSSVPIARLMWTYAWPFTTWGLFTSVQLSSDRWALETFTNRSAVGFYQVLYQFSYTPITMVCSYVFQVIAPILYAKAGDGTDESRLAIAKALSRNVAAASLGFTLALSVLATLIRRWLFGLLLPPAYGPISPLLPLMILAAGLNVTGQLATIGQMAENRTTPLIAPKMGVAVATIVLNALGAKFWGLTGVVMSMAISSAIYAAWIFALTGLHPFKRSAVARLSQTVRIDGIFCPLRVGESRHDGTR